MPTGLLGKRPARPYTSDHTPVADLIDALPAGSIPPIPHNFGHGYDFGRSGWGMLGNGPCDDGTIPESWYAFNGAGNCVWAGAQHEEKEAARNAGRPVPKFTCRTALDDYAHYLGLSGAEALTSDNDQGSDVQEALKLRQTKGVTDASGNVFKIGRTVSGEQGNIDQLWAMAYLFETAGIGVNLQQAQEDAFPGTWDYDASSQTIGGHYIPVMGNNGLISWADRVQFTPKFFEELCDEFYAYVDPERYSRVTGKTLEGHDDADLELYVTEVAKLRAG